MSLLLVPVIIAITLGSVLLVSKYGGDFALKNIRRLRGISTDQDEQER